ncbi:hypothetical protein CLV81_2214 [Flagellimonas meridianipacifica]|uniref:Uncharacterized protein n=2 Tax=Flagellimonas meridianipacifica TaxID=1080225 RepID=A0A2T0M8F8_9FLAO|nr:hypothetical protein CLV81_2214 [Allomuricauda pacifica]
MIFVSYKSLTNDLIPYICHIISLQILPMKANKTLDLSHLELPLEAYFSSLTPQKSGFGASKLKVKDYRDLLFTLESLLNVCILALDNENSANHPHIPEPDVNIQAVLEMAVQLIPFLRRSFWMSYQTVINKTSNS